MNGRTGEFHMHIPPIDLISSGTVNVFIADIDTAQERRFAIYNNDLAVISVIQTVCKMSKHHF